MQHNKTFPANLLKFNAYIKVTESLDAAIKVIKDKRLAYGEPCVVTYKDSSNKDPKNPNGTLKRVVMGIGSMDPSDPYIIGVQYDKDGNPVSQDEINENMQKIIDEFIDKGFTITSIKYSKTEEPNITDDDFSYGDIILGEGAVKHVLDAVDPDSKELVTSKGIYEFITNLLQALEEAVNTLSETVETIKSDVSTCKSSIVTIRSDVSTLKTQVSKIKVTQETLIRDVSTLKNLVSVIDASAIDASLNELYIRVGQITQDVSIINNIKFVSVDNRQNATDISISDIYIKLGKLADDVSSLKEHEDINGIEAVISNSPMITTSTRRHIVTLGIDVDEGFSNSFMEGEDGKVYLAWDKWNKYEE